MNRCLRILILAGLGLPGGLSSSHAQSRTWLDELDYTHITSGWKSPRPNKAVDYDTLRIGGKRYSRGLGTHATCLIPIELFGQATRFYAEVGLDDKIARAASECQHCGEVAFSVIADGKRLYYSDTLRAGKPARIIDLNIAGYKTLYLYVDQLGPSHHDHVDWANAWIEHQGQAPRVRPPHEEKPYILTPPVPRQPLFNGALRQGASPGKPILIPLAFSGAKPLTFRALKLPAGLKLNPKGWLEGQVAQKGTYPIRIEARNALGRAEGRFDLVVGDTLALTPPLGWNSWNCFELKVTSQDILQAARLFRQKGLSDFGWTYLNIDDGWQASRDAQGNLAGNERFPDMKALCDSVHAQGLKIGLYSSPGPLTCGRFAGSYQHEAHDAAQWARWGFDFIKYDWCSYGSVLKQPWSSDDYRRPYALLGQELKKAPRDIVYSLCQYGMDRVWTWGPQVNGSLWRTTGDIIDTWESLTQLSDLNQAGQDFARPGAWNDPDMLVVGWVGIGGKELHPSRLTPSEQYYHISQWALFAAPLLIGCDLMRLDDFTLNLLTNREVLAINQDPLGKQGRRVYQDAKPFPWAEDSYIEVWTKPLANGDMAVGVFNRGEKETSVDWKKLNLPALQGYRTWRDVWRQVSRPATEAQGVTIPRHGVALFRLSR